MIIFDIEEEGLCLVNDSEYGLVVYVYICDLGCVFCIVEGFEYGIVGINDGLFSLVVLYVFFGGMKNSGVGCEGGYWGLEEYFEIKFVLFGFF